MWQELLLFVSVLYLYADYKSQTDPDFGKLSSNERQDEVFNEMNKLEQEILDTAYESAKEDAQIVKHSDGWVEDKAQSLFDIWVNSFRREGYDYANAVKLAHDKYVKKI